MIKYILASCALVLTLAVGSLPAQAQNPSPAPSSPASSQQPVSEEELKKFISAARKLDSISKERNTRVVQAVEKEGLSVVRFREIYAFKQDPKAKPSSQVTTDEQQKYDRAISQLVEIQKDTQTKMGTAVQSEGLEVPRFIQILEAIQKTPTLQKKVEQLLKPAGQK